VGSGIALLFHDRGTRRGSAACLGRTLAPGKTRYQFYRRLGGPQGRSGRAENLFPTGIRSRIVQPVVRPTITGGQNRKFTIKIHSKHINILCCKKQKFLILQQQLQEHLELPLGFSFYYTWLDLRNLIKFTHGGINMTTS
jgi:hypothetical protein